MATKKASSKSELEKTDKGELAVAQGYGEFQDAGFEGVDNSDLQIPFLTILQGLSPQVKSVKHGGLEGAEVGMFHNTVTDDLFDGEDVGVGFVPAISQKKFVEWKPDRGGFVAAHEPEEDCVKKAIAECDFGKLKIGENDLTETYYMYGTQFDLETRESRGPVVIVFKSMMIKPHKRIITALRMCTVQSGGRKVNPPMFAHALKVVSVADKNDKGEFHNIRL